MPDVSPADGGGFAEGGRLPPRRPADRWWLPDPGTAQPGRLREPGARPPERGGPADRRAQPRSGPAERNRVPSPRAYEGGRPREPGRIPQRRPPERGPAPERRRLPEPERRFPDRRQPQPSRLPQLRPAERGRYPGSRVPDHWQRPGFGRPPGQRRPSGQRYPPGQRQPPGRGRSPGPRSASTGHPRGLRRLQGITAGPLRSVRYAFRAFRVSRPFWGGLLVIGGAGEILLSEHGPLQVAIHIGIQGLAGYLIPMMLLLCGLLLWFNPAQRTFYALLSILLALGSWITSNLGGFFIGMLLGLVGGALAFAWTTVSDSQPLRYFSGTPQMLRPSWGVELTYRPILALPSPDRPRASPVRVLTGTLLPSGAWPDAAAAAPAVPDAADAIADGTESAGDESAASPEDIGGPGPAR